MVDMVFRCIVEVYSFNNSSRPWNDHFICVNYQVIGIAEIDIGNTIRYIVLNPSFENAGRFEIRPYSVIHNFTTDAATALIQFLNRSEERRVGKECRSRWSP